MALTTFGEMTRPTIFLTIEAHKLHKEFYTPAQTPVRYSQPVKLNTSAQVVPLAAGDNRNLCIGVSMHNSQENTAYGPNQVTVLMKGFATILCRASSAVAPGPVQIAAGVFHNVVGPVQIAEDKNQAWYGLNLVEQAAATDTDIFGWAIEGADADGTVEVVIF